MEATTTQATNIINLIAMPEAKREGGGCLLKKLGAY